MNEDVQGNLNVSRNLSVGADANINGNTTVGGNLIVGGYIIAPTSGDGEGGGTIDLTAVMSEISSLRLSMSAAQTRIDALSASMGAAQGHINNIYSQKEAMGATVAQLGANLDNAQTRIDALSASMEAAQGHINNIFSRLDILSANLTQLTETVSGGGILPYDRDVYKRVEGASFDTGTVFYCADEKMFLRKTAEGYEIMPGYNKADTTVTDENGAQAHTATRPRGDRIFQCGAHLYRYVAAGDIYEEI